MKNFTRILLVFLLMLPLKTFSQEIEWKRSDEEYKPELKLFRSTQAYNLPTAETLQKNNFEFEISHRFIPTIKSGSKDFWGFDGPVNMRIALGYAPSNKLLITLGRSNLRDNTDLWVKWKALEIANNNFPAAIALRGGIGWNTDVTNRSDTDPDNFQYYGQIIINALYNNAFGIGIVPSYLYNSYIFTDDTQYSFTTGVYLQYYFTELIGVLFEWNPTITGFRTRNNPVAFGIELNTGGHFFKILLTNSVELNPSHFLAGTGQSFNNGDWHIGFNITRLLRF